MRYEVVRPPAYGPSKRIVAHLHCFDLSQFLEIYGAYLPLLRRYCDSVVTFCDEGGKNSGAQSVLEAVVRSLGPGDSLLKIPNKGMDVGAKFCAVHFLNSKAFLFPEKVVAKKPIRDLRLDSKHDKASERSSRETLRRRLGVVAPKRRGDGASSSSLWRRFGHEIRSRRRRAGKDFHLPGNHSFSREREGDSEVIFPPRKVDMVLFLHSKSDAKQRYRYYEWYLNQLPLIPAMVEKDVGGLFNPFLLMEQPGWPRNARYMKELISYFGLEDTYFTFPEGNCFFLSYDMASALYNDTRIYQMLNTNTSVDLPWILEYYKPTKATMKVLKAHIRQGKIAVNNLHLKLGHEGLADSMIEHAYERLPLLMLRRHDKYGVFDFAKAPVRRAFDEHLSKKENEGATSLSTKEMGVSTVSDAKQFRFPLNDRDLRRKYFSKNRTKYDRVVVVALQEGEKSDHLRLSTILNNLLYFAEIAFDVVVVVGDDDENPTKSFMTALEESSYREFFIVNNLLTDVQCRLYANSHLDLAEAFATLGELRDHYEHHGAKEQRYVPYVAASLTIVKTMKTPFQLCHHKWLLALERFVDLTKYSDYILTDDSILIVRSLLDFVDATFRADVEMSVFLASNDMGEKTHYPDFFRRYNRRGIEKIRNFYADTVHDAQRKLREYQQDPSDENINPITYEYMVRNFEIGSGAIFNDVAIYRKAAEKTAADIHFFPFVKSWIVDQGYEIVKLQFLRSRRFDYPADFTDSQRPRRARDLPRDFTPHDYAKLNPDLSHLDDLALRRHFRKHGIKEGRIYTRSQLNQLSGFLRPLIRTENGTGRLFTYNAPLPGPRHIQDLVASL